MRLYLSNKEQLELKNTLFKCLSAKLVYIFREEISEHQPRWVRSRG